jgi:signal transduction histidine kinase
LHGSIGDSSRLAVESHGKRARCNDGGVIIFHCDGRVRIDVKDDGRGMSPEQLSRAIEPFYSTKPLGQGSGLGLSMVEGFAAQSGGAFAIVSSPERGTTASLWLPSNATRPRIG